MGKQHLKRLAAPNTWPIARKKSVYITRPSSGAHQLRYCMPVSMVIGEVLGITQNRKEVKQVLESKKVLVNEKVPKTVKHQFGYMDTLHIPSQKSAYRMLLNTRGKLETIQIPEAEAGFTILKLKKKTDLAKDKVQLSFDNGITFIEKDSKKYKIGDSVVYSFKDKKITKHLPLGKGAYCQVLSGNNIGQLGTIESIDGRVVKIKAENKSFETAKSNTFVLGQEKSELIITNKEK